MVIISGVFMFNQIYSDGRIVSAEEPTTRDRNVHLGEIRNALNTYEWSITNEISTGKPYVAEVSNGTKTYKLTIYLKRTSNGGNARPLDEKRIQLNANQTFVDVEDENHIILLLGIYQNDGSTIFTAWDVEHYRHKGDKTVSLQTKASSISEAMQFGLSRYVKTDGSLAFSFRPEFFYFFMKNRENLFSNSIIGGSVLALSEEIFDSVFPLNRIVFGAPGTGKSYKLNEDKNYFPSGNFERVTFHSHYSYAQFVGTYKPKPVYKDHNDSSNFSYKKYSVAQIAGVTAADYQIQNEPSITYEYVAGPFLEILTKALLDYQDNGDEAQKYLLIVEEINRANVASVFGDIFQLLDRKSNGESEYRITTSEELRNYLEGLGLNNGSELFLPPNFYLWATMNSADQGVYPVDTAFKRRWNFEYIGINEGEEKISNKEVEINGYGKCNWNNFRKTLNNKLIEANVKEDKLIGPFFLNENELDDDRSTGESKFQRAFKNKLIMYLAEDVLKHNTSKIFGDLRTLSQIYEAYEKVPSVKVFEALNEKEEDFIIRDIAPHDADVEQVDTQTEGTTDATV